MSLECRHGLHPDENPCWSLIAHPMVIGEELSLTVGDSWRGIEVDQIVLHTQGTADVAVNGDDIEVLESRCSGESPDRASEPEHWRRLWRLADTLHADSLSELVAKAALLELVEPPFHSSPILLSPLRFRGFALAATGYNDRQIDVVLGNEPGFRGSSPKQTFLERAARSVGQPTPERAVTALIGWGAVVLDKTSVGRAEIIPFGPEAKPMPAEQAEDIRDQLLTWAIAHYGFGDREAFILRSRINDGMTGDEIAAALNIAGPVVDANTTKIYKKMGIEKGVGMMTAVIKIAGVNVNSWRPSPRLDLNTKEICILRGWVKGQPNQSTINDIFDSTGEKLDTFLIGNEINKLIAKLGADTKVQALWFALTEPTK